MNLSLNFFSDKEIKYNTINVNNESNNGVILPLSKFNINLKYIEQKDELVICMENLIIFDKTTKGNPKHGEYYCSEITSELSAQDLISNGAVVKGDSIGIYRLDYLYKRE